MRAVGYCWTQKIGSVDPLAIGVQVPAVQVTSVLPSLPAVALPAVVHPEQSAVGFLTEPQPSNASAATKLAFIAPEAIAKLAGAA